MQFDLLTGYSILTFVKDLLKKRFPDNRLKQEVYESGDKLNFACPYCGDSAHDPKKKRGNLYPNRGFYRCYNDGCSVKVSTEKFISNYSLKYSLGVPDIKSTEVKWVAETTKKKRGSLIELLINKNATDHLLRIDYLAERFSLVPCDEADPLSNVGKFIAKRGLANIPAFNECSYFDTRDDKIYLFNLDNRSGKVLGFAVRRLNNEEGPKYLIKNYSELKKNGLVRTLPDDLLSDIDNLNNYFNVLNVDFSKPIMVTEGQIDAMFLINSIATTGISKSRLLLENLLSLSNTLILFDSDSAGKTQSIDLIKKGYRVFLWNRVFNDLSKKYKIKQATARFIIKDVNDLFLFMRPFEPELDQESFNLFLLQYFSESPFDLIWV
jgi:hypothetical protein